MSSDESGNGADSPQETSEPVLICPVCPKAITEREKLKRHIAKHMRPTNFKCNICGERFIIKPDLVRHVKMSHRSGETETRSCTRYQNVILDYTCRICGGSITSKMTLERHTLEHNNQKDAQFHCRKCLKGFGTQTELSEHRELEHEGPNQSYRIPGQSFECQVCKKILHTRRTYDEHVRLHNKEYHYYCQECNKGFMRKYQLTQHMETPHVGSTSTPVSAATAPPSVLEPDPLALPLGSDPTKRRGREAISLICTLCSKELPDEESFHFHIKLHSSDYVYLCCLGRFGDFEQKKFVKFLKKLRSNAENEDLEALLSRGKPESEELEELVTDVEQFLRTWLEVDQVFGDTAMMQESLRVRDGIYLPKIVEKRMDQLSQKYQDLYY